MMICGVHVNTAAVVTVNSWLNTKNRELHYRGDKRSDFIAIEQVMPHLLASLLNSVLFVMRYFLVELLGEQMAAQKLDVQREEVLKAAEVVNTLAD